MYTVLRFQASNETRLLLFHFGTRLNALVPGAFDGMDEEANRFSCTVSSDGDAATHILTIVRYLNRIEGVLSDAVAANISMELDIAVEPGDLASIRFDSVTISLLAMYSIGLEITDYRSPSG